MPYPTSSVSATPAQAGDSQANGSLSIPSVA